MDSTLKKKKKKGKTPNSHPNRPSTKKRKKGRPSKADLAPRYRTRSLPKPETPRRRSLRPLRRRRGLEDEEPYLYEYDEVDDEVEAEVEAKKSRREKQLTLVLKLNPRQNSSGARTSDLNCSASSSLEDNRESESKIFKRRRINGHDDDESDVRSNKSDDPKLIKCVLDDELQEEKRNGVPKSVHSVPGIRSDSSLPTHLPDRRMLEFILHKLQKKDTYGVYAEPVDPKELPDYHDIIEHPMDFGTVRKKLASDAYTSLEQFESDVFLVCTNAMQYNAPETIYYKQARAIQELAIKRFEKLRVVACNEMELESLQKTRSNSTARKSMKKPMSMSAHEPVGSDFSSGATLANTRDTCTGPNMTQAVAFNKSGSVDGLVMEGNSFLDENKHVAVEELSVKGFHSKFGRKLFVVDENRRSTYDVSDQPVTRTESVLATFESEMKQLVVVGLHADHSYARSLARFAGTLGPVAWRIASRKIEQALPASYKFGRGWVGEYEPLQTPVLLLENYSQREPAYNLICQHKSESNEVQEIKEKSKVIQDVYPTSVALKSETSAGAVCDHTPKRSNLDDKLSCFGIVSVTNPNVQDMRLQQQNSRNIDFSKPDRSVLKQIEVSCSSSLSKTIPSNASLKLEPHSQEMTSRLLEMVSRSRNLMHSGPFKQTEALEILHNSENAYQSSNGARTDGGGVDALPNVRAINTLDGTSTTGNLSLPFVSNHQVAGALSFFGHGNNKQGLDDPVEVMKKFLNSPMVDNSQVSPPVLSSRRDDSYLATATAKAWMSVGAQGLKLSDISPSQMKIATASLYNPTRELPCLVSRSCEDNSGLGGSQSESRFPGQIHAQPVRVGEDSRFQNSRLTASCQLPASDLSRFPMESPWRGFVPHNPHQRQKAEMAPPDLNISFQSAGSPVQQQSSGVQADSQQPDLALQL